MAYSRSLESSRPSPRAVCHSDFIFLHVVGGRTGVEKQQLDLLLYKARPPDVVAEWTLRRTLGVRKRGAT